MWEFARLFESRRRNYHSETLAERKRDNERGVRVVPSPDKERWYRRAARLFCIYLALLVRVQLGRPMNLLNLNSKQLLRVLREHKLGCWCQITVSWASGGSGGGNEPCERVIYP